MTSVMVLCVCVYVVLTLLVGSTADDGVAVDGIYGAEDVAGDAMIRVLYTAIES